MADTFRSPGWSRLILALVAFSLPLVALGQRPAQRRTAAPARDHPREIVFTVFALRPLAGLQFVPDPEQPPEPLIFHPTARSPEYRYRGDGPIRFEHAGSGALAVMVPLPAEGERFLFLFIPNVDLGHGYRVHVLEDRPAGAGGIGVLNLSGLELSGRIGERPTVLGPGRRTEFSITRPGEIELFASHRGRRYRAYRDSFDPAAHSRALLILFPPFYAGSLEVQARLLVEE